MSESKNNIKYVAENLQEKTCRPTFEYKEGVRESMTILPDWMQSIITLITGKPMPNEKPSFSCSPIIHLIFTLTILFGLASVNLYLLSQHTLFGLIILPITWVICTGQLRKIQVVFAHHCVHRTFFLNNPKANDIMLEVLTVFALVQNGEEYRRDHLGHHNRDLFTTKQDSDAALLFTLGFLPGLKKSALWKKLYIVLVSPKFHWMFLGSRFSSNFIRRSLPWRLSAILWLCVILIGSSFVTVWWHVALVVWLPFFIFYNISALLQFITEHAWMISSTSPKNLEAYADRCWGRFFGDQCPASSLRGISAVTHWLKWGVKMLFIHAPVRFGCFVGDLPAHDWHHLCTFKNYDPTTWPTAIFSRQLMIDNGDGLGMDIRELWGLGSMLSHVFTQLELADKDNFTNNTKISYILNENITALK